MIRHVVLQKAVVLPFWPLDRASLYSQGPSERGG